MFLQFWTYNAPSSQDFRDPSAKFYADPTGNSFWEGNANVYVTDASTNARYQLTLEKLAHSRSAGFMVGSLRNTQQENINLPCYVTPPDNRVDFFNGWECWRLYTCSNVPHIVTAAVYSSNQVTIQRSEGPYTSLVRGLRNRLEAANQQIGQIAPYEQSFKDKQGNTYSFTAQVQNNGPNLFWTVDAATKFDESGFPGLPDFHYNGNPAANYFETVDVAEGTAFDADANFPQSASVVTYVGLDHQSYSKIDFFQTGFAAAPPPPTPNAAACQVKPGNIASGALGILGGFIAAAGILAAPFTAGASLAPAMLGIAAAGTGATSGIISIVGGVC
ncbi:uncharacterized protein EV422DRAFT_563120 [Fimicolochytrium jonesii]|uniref:uncharacterized protein n=1 Tax=Fimicolochytrium jonesii TaxID=1396493 RepID=UPI0022FDEB5C|nr:uncharacterized protein EV422DRAFT_563120 [Fimicolochytrium jonesii]KAI8827039.1 hypothetical protein EV422DRAFT_563120 [Fimicolochytrium jonesii]